MPTTVVNMDKTDVFDVRIDRATKWGNPYKRGRDGTREEVIRMYRFLLDAYPDMKKEAKRELRNKVLG